MTVAQDTLAVQMTSAIVAVNQVIATIGQLNDGSPVIVKTVYTAVQDNRVPFDAAIAALDADIDIVDPPGGVVPGIPAPMLATILLNQTSDVQQQWLVILAEAYLLRVGQNCANAPG